MSKSDLAAGSKFTRLTMIGQAQAIGGNRRYECECECGNRLVVLAYNLVSGNTKSCGCLLKDVASAKATRHGGRYTDTYILWCNIKARCSNLLNSRYSDYGERGILMYSQWEEDFSAFERYLHDSLGPKPSKAHSLDRVDNDKGYVPGNLRWATRAEQASNKRNTLKVEYMGETLSLPDWSRRLGIRYGLLHRRIRVQNWPVEAAFTAAPYGLMGKRLAEVKEELT